MNKKLKSKFVLFFMLAIVSFTVFVFLLTIFVDDAFAVFTSECTGGTITYTDSNGLNPRSSPAYAGGYTVHTFTTAFADTEITPKIVTANGDVQRSTAQSKFGGASALFDGTGDYLSLVDSDDWNFGSGDFTIDFWVKFNVLPSLGARHAVVGQFLDVSNHWYASIVNISGTYYWGLNVPAGPIAQMGTTVSLGSWYHVAYVRSGNSWQIFQDGVSLGTITDATSLPNVASVLVVGQAGNNTSYINGYIDEFRVSKSIARWTANFTPLTSSYMADANTKLLLHVDSSTFTVNGSGDVDYLVVGGGGSGGGIMSTGLNGTGGGGGGGLRTGTISVTSGDISVTVGAGGVGDGDKGVSGGNSVFSTISAAGGGGGGTGTPSDVGSGIDGGSGGGSGTYLGGHIQGYGNIPSTSPSQGNNGGLGIIAANNYGGGGGGGATAVGGNGTNSTGGAGGAGTASSISGSSTTYGGGGGGGTYNGGTPGLGGAGGGGAGGTGGSSTAGTANTGGGGGGTGGGAGTGNGGNGGSGIVIIRYSIPPAPTVTAINPTSGVNSGSVSITSVTGTNFVSGATVKLTKSGESDISCTGFSFTSSTTLSSGSCPITGAVAGAWNVVVTNPDTQTGTLTNSFTVTDPSSNTNISSTDTEHFAWSDSIGWIDFYSTDNVNVTSTQLTGYASSSFGYIALDCATSPNGDICGTSDFKVLNNGSGSLSGWAYNDIIGWISFDSATASSSYFYQVTINPSTGDFSGWAYSDVVGWISFNCLNDSSCATSNYKVKTSWTSSQAEGNLISSIFDIGVANGVALNTIMWQGSQPSGTSVKFQIVSGMAGALEDFKGPDGSDTTYYTPIGPGYSTQINLQYNNNIRYFRYKVFLSFDAARSIGPRIDDIIINYSP